MRVMEQVSRYRVAQLRAGVPADRVPPFKVARSALPLLLRELRSTLAMPIMFGATEAIQAAALVEQALAGDMPAEDVVKRLTVHKVKLELVEG